MDILKELVSRNNWFVLTGAGVSLDSGIPTYRDSEGNWTRSMPVENQDFIRSSDVRRRFWARNMVGWRFMSEAKPNQNHLHLARIQKKGVISCLTTQNVDGLHQKAGSTDVIDLHGRLDSVTCLSCGLKLARQYIQNVLIENNPHYAEITGAILPDGDAEIDKIPYGSFFVPDCPNCGGILKPDAVFFGDSVPKHVVSKAIDSLKSSNGVLVVGSSLNTYSGFRFCRLAKETRKKLIIINKSPTRADNITDIKVSADCSAVLSEWAAFIS